MKLEEFKNNEIQEVEKNNSPEKVAQNAADHQDHKKRLEDYSYKELLDMKPEDVTRLNVDFRERYEAEMRDMSRNEYREYKIEDSLRKFSYINFSAEDSFDSYAKENYPKLNELKSKTVYPVYPMGTILTENDRAPVGEYMEEEKRYIKDIRDKIDAPTTETVMQKVISEEKLENYLNPKNLQGDRTDCQVFGFVAKAEDSAAFTRTPQDCYDNLRLDYDETEFKDPNKPVYVIRFTDGKNYDIPYNQEFNGKYEHDQPFTGNGFISSEKVAIPEYEVRKDQQSRGAVVTDGIIYKISPDGKEEPFAFFNKQDKCFEPIHVKEG